MTSRRYSHVFPYIRAIATLAGPIIFYSLSGPDLYGEILRNMYEILSGNFL